MAKSHLLYHYKLSVEELVLTLFTINCGEVANALLARAYDVVPEEHFSILLTAGRPDAAAPVLFMRGDLGALFPQ